MASPTLLTALPVPELEQAPDPNSLSAALQRLPDTRTRRGRRSPRALVLTRSVLGKLAGETTMSGIAPWAHRRTAWRTDVFRLPRPRLPGAQTSTLVSANVDLDDRTAVFAQVVVPPLPALPAPPAPPPPPVAVPRGCRHLALDGKTLRGTRRPGATPQPAVHVLELYAVTHQGMLVQSEGATKDHEVPCAAQVIAGRDLAGWVITAAALHTQRDWWAHSSAQRGDDSLLAKEHQRGRRQEIACLFDGAWPPW